MGLGKTLEAISMLAYLREIRGVSRPYLVLAPKSTLHNWMKEFARWAPRFCVVKFHAGDKASREQIRDEVIARSNFDVVVTSYEVAIIEKAALQKHRWKYLVIDEAHRIKNEKSLLARVVRKFHSEHRLLLTGTPLQNNLHELYALLNFLLPELFSSSDDFDAWFRLEESDPVKQKEAVDRLHRVLRPFLLRRLKSEVERALPPKKEIKLFVGMSAMQTEWYKKCLMKDLDVVTGSGTSQTRHKVRLLNIIMQLRKVCNHPYLFEGAEKGPRDGTTGEDIVTNSGKMVVLDKLLPRLRSLGSRVLIFCQMTRMLDILEDYLNLREYPYARIDGNTSGEDRERQIEDYNRAGSDLFVFLLSTRAGGLGINLATADTVVLYDSDWNPQVDLQAQDRVHRIGQTRPVIVYRFVTDNSVETKIVQRAERKLFLDALVIQQGRLIDQQKGGGGGARSEELLAMIRFGADAIFKSPGGTIEDADIDAILVRGEERTAALGDKLKTQALNLLSFGSADDAPESDYFQWDGTDWRAVRQGGKISVPGEAFEMPKRDRPATLAEQKFLNPARPVLTRKLPKPPKAHVTHDFQFFPKRLQELLNKEREAYVAKRADVESNEPEKADYGELTPDEEAEKERLLTAGFTTWTRRDYLSFVRGCEQHGRTAYAKVAEVICNGKTAADVEAYAKVFWERWADLKDGERAIKAIERGEASNKRDNRRAEALTKKVGSYADPWKQLRVAFRAERKETAFTAEEDAFLVCAMHKEGIGNWDQVRSLVFHAPQLRFDWFIRTRTAAEIGQRCNILLRVIEREVMGDEETEDGAAPKKRKKPSSKTATPTPAELGNGKKPPAKRAKGDQAGSASAPAPAAAASPGIAIPTATKPKPALLS